MSYNVKSVHRKESDLWVGYSVQKLLTFHCLAFLFVVLVLCIYFLTFCLAAKQTKKSEEKATTTMGCVYATLCRCFGLWLIL